MIAIHSEQGGRLIAQHARDGSTSFLWCFFYDRFAQEHGRTIPLGDVKHRAFDHRPMNRYSTTNRSLSFPAKSGE
jgi:hypothetical protein